MVEIRPSLPGDSWMVLAALRQQEVDELSALGSTSEECVRLGLQFGNAMTAFIDGEPAGIFGVADYGDHQIPWAVFTKVIDAHPVAFLRASKRWKASHSAKLVQYVDARNERAVRWFKWLGFEVSDAEPLGLNGEPFHKAQVG
jgi:hypothetical protein